MSQNVRESSVTLLTIIVCQTQGVLLVGHIVTLQKNNKYRIAYIAQGFNFLRVRGYRDVEACSNVKHSIVGEEDIAS